MLLSQNILNKPVISTILILGHMQITKGGDFISTYFTTIKLTLVTEGNLLVLVGNTQYVYNPFCFCVRFRIEVYE